MYLPVVVWGIDSGGTVGLGGSGILGFCTDIRRSVYVLFFVVSSDANF